VGPILGGPYAVLLYFPGSFRRSSSRDGSSGQSTGRSPSSVRAGVTILQHILDREWQRTLRDLRAYLRTGGVLAFDSRNPVARAWETWGSQECSRRDTPHRPLVEWADVSEPDEGVVTARFHNQFLRTGESVTETTRFAFRHADSLGRQLAAAGFEVDAVYEDWARTSFTPNVSFMVFTARAR
jgi:hypothetical protein